MKKAIIMALAFVLLGVAYILTPPPQSDVLEEVRNFTVEYAIVSGFTGWEKSVTVNESGEVIIEETPPFFEEGEKSISSFYLNKEETEELYLLIVSADLFSLEDSYRCEPHLCPTDFPVNILRIDINGRKKEINMYVPPQLPEDLSLLIEKMSDISEENILN